MKTVSERLDLILEETGLSQAELARRCRGVISQQGINKISTGKTKAPSAEVLAAIAKAAGYRVEWLVNGKGPKTDDGVPGHGPLTPQDHNDIAQALEDAMAEEGVKLGAAEKATLIAGFLKKLGR